MKMFRVCFSTTLENILAMLKIKVFFCYSYLKCNSRNAVKIFFSFKPTAMTVIRIPVYILSKNKSTIMFKKFFVFFNKTLIGYNTFEWPSWNTFFLVCRIISSFIYLLILNFYHMELEKSKIVYSLYLCGSKIKYFFSSRWFTNCWIFTI